MRVLLLVCFTAFFLACNTGSGPGTAPDLETLVQAQALSDSGLVIARKEPQAGIALIRQGRQLFSSVGDTRNVILSDLRISSIYYRRNFYDSAGKLDAVSMQTAQAHHYHDLKFDVLLSQSQKSKLDSAVLDTVFKKAEALINTYQLEKKRSYLEFERGKLHLNRSKTVESVANFEKAAILAKQYHQDTLLGMSYCYLGLGERQLGKTDEAIEHTLAAISLQEKTRDLEGLAYSYLHLALLYEQIRELEKQKIYNQKSLAVFRQLDPKDIAMTMILHNIAISYRGSDSALAYYREALDLAVEMSMPNVEEILQATMGAWYLERREMDSAAKYLFLAKNKLEVSDPGDKLGEVYDNIGTMKYMENKPDEALAYFLKAGEIYKKTKSQGILTVYNKLAGHYFVQKDYKTALHYLQRYITLKDSLVNINLNEKINQLQALNEIEKKNAALLISEQNQQLLTLKVRDRERGLIWTSVISGLLLLLIGFVLYFLRQKSRNEAELKVKNEHIRNLMNELTHRVKNNFQVLSNVFSIQASSGNSDSALILANKARVDALLLLHQKLSMDESHTFVNPVEYIRELAGYLILPYGFPPEKLQLEFDSNIPEIDVDRLIPLGLIVNEMISNSLKHALPGNPDPTLGISLHMKDADTWVLRIRDNGPAKEEQLNKQDGKMGMRLLHIFVRQLRAKLSHKIDNGLEWTLEFNPRADFAA